MFCIFASLLFFSTNIAVPDYKAMIFGAIFGVGFFVAVYSSASGYQTGSMVLTSTIINMSLIIPVLYSTIALGEEIRPLKIIGILLFTIVFLLASIQTKEKARQGRFRFVWLVFVSAGFLANGFTAVVQKNYRIMNPTNNNGIFMAIAYFTAGLLFVLRYVYINKKQALASDVSVEKTFIVKLVSIAIISGAGSFGGNLLLSYLSDKVNGAVLYPCLNGGLCILLSVFSILLFKEKLTLMKLSAFIVGITAIILLNI